VFLAMAEVFEYDPLLRGAAVAAAGPGAATTAPTGTIEAATAAATAVVFVSTATANYAAELASRAARPVELISLDVVGPNMRQLCIAHFRLKYLRDVMLHPTIDESFAVTALNSILAFTTLDVCQKVRPVVDLE
jgi:hypothetical protein